MQNVLVVVDMQNDFISLSLGSKEAESIVKDVYSYIRDFKGKVFFTQDTHTSDYLESEEGKNLPIKHCIKNTIGWEIEDSIKTLIKIPPIEKETFGSVTLGQILKEENEKEKIESITLIGLCTDICVLSNALLLKAFLPNVHIVIEERLCKGTSIENHNRALKCMECSQIEIRR